MESEASLGHRPRSCCGPRASWDLLIQRGWFQYVEAEKKDFESVDLSTPAKANLCVLLQTLYFATGVWIISYLEFPISLESLAKPRAPTSANRATSIC